MTQELISEVPAVYRLSPPLREPGSGLPASGISTRSRSGSTRDFTEPEEPSGISEREGLPDIDSMVFIGLGSNLGDRSANISEAIDLITRRGARVERKSSLYETEPVGYNEQDWFINQVIAVRPPGDPALTPPLFLRMMLEVEDQMGRVREIEGGPRIIDLDLLLFGGNVEGWDLSLKTASKGTALVVPHPLMHRRRFVLEPLCEIAPGVVHPVLEKTMTQLLDELNDPSAVRRIR